MRPDAGRSGLGQRVARSAFLPSGHRAVAGAAGLREEGCTARQVRQRRTDEDTELFAFDAAGDQETVRGTETVLYGVAESVAAAE